MTRSLKQPSASPIEPARQGVDNRKSTASWQSVLQRAHVAPQSLTAGDVQILQRSVGNRATTRLLRPVLQTEMRLGPVGDRYEQEADRVADQVVASAPAPVQRLSAQRESEGDEGANERSRIKAPASSAVTTRPQITPVQRRVFARGTVQRTDHGPEGGEVESSVAEQIGRVRGGGHPLDARVRRQMEAGFGADFSNVRIHTGSQAHALNRSLNARAFTVQRDIFFGQGQYDPGSKQGQRLLAHELTHTVQQGATAASGVQRQYTPTGTEDPLTSYQQGDQSLFYGIEAVGDFRNKTVSRMNPQQKSNPYPTIDSINRGVGINAAMSGDQIKGLFKVRAALEDNVNNWRTHLPQADANVLTDPTLSAWIGFLQQNMHTVGMYDLGDTKKSGFGLWRNEKGKKKLNSSKRLTKNAKKDEAVTRDQVFQILSTDTATGLNFSYGTNMPAGFDGKTYYNVMRWIYKAFFRRTSKLGLEFATKVLDANVYFNHAATVGWQGSGTGTTEKAGLKKVSSKESQGQNRAITVSEYRHVNKMIKKGVIPKNKVHFYNEYK